MSSARGTVLLICLVQSKSLLCVLVSLALSRFLLDVELECDIRPSSCLSESLSSVFLRGESRGESLFCVNFAGRNLRGLVNRAVRGGWV